MPADPVDILEEELDNSRGRPFAPIEEAIEKVYGEKSQYTEYMGICRSFQGNFRQFEHDYDIDQIAKQPEKFEPEVEEIVSESIEAASILRKIFIHYENSSGKEEKFWKIIFEECLDTLYRDFVKIDNQVGNLGNLDPVFGKIEDKFANTQEIQFAVELAKRE